MKDFERSDPKKEQFQKGAELQSSPQMLKIRDFTSVFAKIMVFRK